MTVNIRDTALKARLDAANPNSISDMFRVIKLGSAIRAMPTWLRIKNPAAGAAPLYDLATVDPIFLPDDAKAATILAAYARTTSNGATLGPLAIQAFGATPADGQIAVSPNGNIVVLASVQYTNIDVLYQPDKYDVVEVSGPVAAGIFTIPATLTARGVVSLLEAEVLVGTTLGPKIVLVPAAGLPATTKAQLNVGKTQVQFNNATDAPVTVRVKLAISAAVDVDALLNNDATFA